MTLLKQTKGVRSVNQAEKRNGGETERRHPISAILKIGSDGSFEFLSEVRERNGERNGNETGTGPINE